MFGSGDSAKQSAVTRAEVVTTNFLIQHNLPLATSDHLGPLFRAIFPDSEIAKQYGCARTKTMAIINKALGPAGVICRTPNAECRTPNAERRTPNAERRTPNAERRTPNAERRTPNAERRTPNAERRTPNAEFRSAVYRVKHVLSVNTAAIEIIDISDK